MALDALRGCAAIHAYRLAQRTVLFLVALFAGHVAMRHIQREPRAIMIEGIGCPLHRDMTG